MRSNPNLLFVAGLLALALPACDEAPPRPQVVLPQQKVQPDPGPPDPETVRDRLLRLSGSGRLPQELSSDGIDRILTQLDALEQAKAAMRDGEGTPEAVSSEGFKLETACREEAGLSCTELLYSP